MRSQVVFTCWTFWDFLTLYVNSALFIWSKRIFISFVAVITSGVHHITMNFINLVFMRTFINLLALFMQIINILGNNTRFTFNTVAYLVNDNMSLIGGTFLLFLVKILYPFPYRYWLVNQLIFFQVRVWRLLQFLPILVLVCNSWDSTCNGDRSSCNKCHFLLFLNQLCNLFRRFCFGQLNFLLKLVNSAIKRTYNIN